MIYYTKYAEEKFEILNKHKVFFTREQVEDAIATPEKSKRKGKYFTFQKDKLKVISQKDGEMIKIITFYPTK